MRKICILGSTGSIGTQTLEVVKNLGNIEVVGLTAHENIELLLEQIMQFKPLVVAVFNPKKADELRKKLPDNSVTVLSGIEGVICVAKMEVAETIVNALVGVVGLTPTVEAIVAGKNIALANKETLVAAGEVIMQLAKKHGVKIYPIDSEHSAIFQCLQGNEQNKIGKILLTASGGPFRGKTLAQLESVTVQQALAHPNWSMGAKISIDSATMMNKGLEVIEAKWLFDVDFTQIEVLVHPQSVVHSMVEFADGSIMAQLGAPDMRLPISYALTYPERENNDFKRIDFLKQNNLTFEKPDFENFPCLGLAFKAIEMGGLIPAVLNSANETAVSLFLAEKISFLQISKLIEMAITAYTEKEGEIMDMTIENVISAHNFATQFVLEKYEVINC